MGVPAFFRWLSRKYPKIIAPVLEDDPITVDGIEYPGDYNAPNQNGELDNLYLDMNGIVHPCTHPEGRPAPETEDEMMLEVFKYTDRVVSMARPRKVLMIAVDGVAPRAKMNQQRSRRFRSAQDAQLAAVAKEEELIAAEKRGEVIDDAVQGKKVWDTNVITPGTPFMDLLAQSLRYWVAFKLNNDPGWKDLKVIISDATVPGEGEHKVMEFIRSQRNDPQYNPNTSHCIYGLDADLIFLGLATHEPHFRILREDVFAQNKLAKSGKKPFIWLNIEVLRQYLEVELEIPRTGFPFDLERALDDWVFMAFFCGNDFLPHLPSLDVRESGIDILLKAWRQSLAKMGGYMTCDGDVNLHRVQLLMRAVAASEGDIFRKRHDQEMRRQANDRSRKADQKRRRSDKFEAQGVPLAKSRGETAPVNPLDNIPLYTASGESVGETHMTNQELKDSQTEITLANDATANRKRQQSDARADHNDDEPEDNIMFWQPGYHDRYYERKFDKSAHDEEFVGGVVQKYIEGICWVLKYYYQACPSWTWFYPYHYAPFAQDMTNLDHIKIEFDSGAPFLPYEQLMSVLPAASAHTLPKLLRSLMSDEDSPIIDFYPEDFPIDMNGKKQAWHGIALLPFIDEKRLLTTVRAKYKELTEEEMARNCRKEPILLVAPENPMRARFDELYETSEVVPYKFQCWVSNGLTGIAERTPEYVPRRPLICPVQSAEHTDIPNDGTVTVKYTLPKEHTSKSMLLQGFNEINLVLSYDEREQIINRRNKSDRGDDRIDWREERRNRNGGDEFSEPRPLPPYGFLGYMAEEENRAKSQTFSQYGPPSNGYGGYGNQNQGPGQNYGQNQGGYQGYQGYQGNGRQGGYGQGGYGHGGQGHGGQGHGGQGHGGYQGYQGGNQGYQGGNQGYQGGNQGYQGYQGYQGRRN